MDFQFSFSHFLMSYQFLHEDGSGKIIDDNVEEVNWRPFYFHLLNT